MKEIDNIKAFLSKPNEITIVDNGIKLKLLMSPLKVSDLADVWTLLNLVKNVNAESPSNILSNVTPEIVAVISNLAIKSLKPNHPDIDDDTLKQLIIRNIFIFANELISQNLNMKMSK